MRALVLILALAGTLAAADVLVPGTSLVVPVPAGWRPLTEPGTVLTYAAPDGVLRLAVARQDLDTQEGPAAFAKRCLADLQRLLVEVELVDWAFAEPRGGRLWSRVRYRFRIGTQRFEQTLWTTTEGAIGLCITLGGPAEADLAARWRQFDEDLTGSRPIPGR